MTAVEDLHAPDQSDVMCGYRVGEGRADELAIDGARLEQLHLDQLVVGERLVDRRQDLVGNALSAHLNYGL